MNTTDPNEMLLSDEVLMNQLRAAIEPNATLSTLTDDQLWAILDSWDSYVEAIMSESEEADDDGNDIVEIDPEDFYSFLSDELEADEDNDIDLSQDDAIELITAWIEITNPAEETDEAHDNTTELH